MADAIAALLKAQTEMGKAIKNATNPHLKSNYADLGAVMDACFDALHANGFAVMQPCGQDEHGAFVETVFAHTSGADFRSRVYLVIGKNDMQGVGSAITYARRYGLLGMAGLAPEDDDGEATKSQRTSQPRDGQSQPRAANEPPIYQKMLAGLSSAGMRAVNDPKFRADLDGLRKSHPDLAAKVDQEIRKIEDKEAA